MFFLKFKIHLCFKYVHASYTEIVYNLWKKMVFFFL